MNLYSFKLVLSSIRAGVSEKNFYFRVNTMSQLVKTLVNSNKFFKGNLKLRTCRGGGYYSTKQSLSEDVEEVRIPVPWGHIAGKWWGKKDGTPVLGIHDWQGNSSSFDRLIPLLNISNFLAIDLPGHGHSSQFPVGKLYTFSEFLYTLRRTINYLQWEKYSFIGHSFGSALCFFYSSIYREDIDYVISLGCAKASSFTSRFDFPEYLEKGIVELLKYENEVGKGTAPNSELSDNGKPLKDPRINTGCFGVINEEMIMEFAKHITCPVLSIERKNGILNDPTNVYYKSKEILKENSKHFEHFKVDGNDYAHINTPESISPVINKFLSSLEGKYWGSKEKRPFLLLHGWQDNASSFDKLIPFLHKDRGYLAVDLPGHGFSSHYPKGAYYTFEDTLLNIRLIQNYFSWNKVSLIGHSLGAVIAFMYSAVFNNDVDIFIGLDAFKPRSSDPGQCYSGARGGIEKFLEYDSRDQNNVKRYEESEILEKMKKALNTENEEICKVIMKRGLAESNGLYAPVRDPRIKSFPPLVSFTHNDNLKFANRIKCNILVIKSEETTYFEPKEIFYDYLEVIRKNAKYLECVKISGIHHFHLEKPELVASIVEKFLKRIE